MKLIPILLLAFVLTACHPPSNRGGSSTTTIPAVGTAGQADISLHQPQNPDGPSSTTYEEVTTVVHTDGRVESTLRKTSTKVGGSQDYAKILKEYGKTEYFQGLVFGLLLICGGWLAYRKEWPLVAGILAAGGLASIFVAWWAGAIAIFGAALTYVGYKVALPQLSAVIK